MDIEDREITYRRRIDDTSRQRREDRKIADMAKELKRLKEKKHHEN